METSTSDTDQQQAACVVSANRWRLTRSIAGFFAFVGVLLNVAKGVTGIVATTAERKSATSVLELASSIDSSLVVMLLWLSPVFLVSVVLWFVSKAKLKALVTPALNQNQTAAQ